MHTLFFHVFGSLDSVSDLFALWACFENVIKYNLIFVCRVCGGLLQESEIHDYFSVGPNATLIEFWRVLEMKCNRQVDMT